MKTTAEFYIGSECLGSIGYEGHPDRVKPPKTASPERFRAWVKQTFSGRIDWSARPSENKYPGTRYVYSLTPGGVKVLSVDVVPKKGRR